MVIFHITPQEEWLAAQTTGLYRPGSLDTEGFIHCSTAGQVAGVANALFAGQTSLLLLVINPDRVPAEIRYEDCYETGQLFPHIYGVLPVDAVVRVMDYRPGQDGLFTSPAL